MIAISCQDKKPETSESLKTIAYTMHYNAQWVLEHPEINSISIGTYSEGEMFTGYYGEIDSGKENKPNDNSIFEIASVTKTFTGIITAQAVLDGKLAVEDDIRKYLEGSYPNLEYNGRPIQIRDLLTHTSGIRRDFSSVLGKLFSIDATLEDKQAIKKYTTKELFNDLKEYKLDTIPGTRYDYSPVVAPEILAFILESVYEKSYEQLLNEMILQKAGMKNTKLKVADHEVDLVNSYTDKGDLVMTPPISMTGAGSALTSTIPDLNRYMKFLFDDSNPVIKEMQRILFTDKEEDDDYGYFWKLGGTDFMHNGGTNGSTNWLIVMPEQKIGFTVMFNSNGEVSSYLINDIASSIYRDIEAYYPKKTPYYLINDEVEKDLQKGIQLYQKLKKEASSEFHFEEGKSLNKIGYRLLREDKVPEAIEVFKFIVSEFPDASNPYDSLAEGYFMNKQYDLALLNYKKSLELNPKNTNAERMIQQIQSVKD